MFIPGFLQEFTMVSDHAGDLAKCPGIEPVIACELDLGQEPELGLRSTAPDMDVRLFARTALIGVKEELDSIESQGNRHDALQGWRSG
jgi:hypothetical protein